MHAELKLGKERRRGIFLKNISLFFLVKAMKAMLSTMSLQKVQLLVVEKSARKLR